MKWQNNCPNRLVEKLPGTAERLQLVEQLPSWGLGGNVFNPSSIRKASGLVGNRQCREQCSCVNGS